MKKNDVLNWLNRRLSLHKDGNPFSVNDSDIIFIRNYIYHYKKETIEPQRIVNSIVHKSAAEMMFHFDFMISKLVHDFKITTKTHKNTIQDPNINLMLGKHPYARTEVEFIDEYV